MSRRSRLRRLIVLLLLATLPLAALGGYARESARECAMGGSQHDLVAGDMTAEHCQHMHADPVAPSKHTAHCPLCGDLGTPLVEARETTRDHRVAALVTLPPDDFLLCLSLAAPWRPPRHF